MTVLEELSNAIDAVCAEEPARLADGDAIVALHRQLARLEATTARAAATFEAGGSWEADGARSAAAWLTTRTHLPLATTRRRLRLGRAPRCMPVTEAAWLAGDIDASHVHALEAARTPASEASFTRDEQLLVEQAKNLVHHHFTRALAYWCLHADPDGTEDRAEADYEARRLHLSPTYGGTWALDGRFDPIAGTVVHNALKRIEDELFALDWAEAKARVGEGVCGTDLRRTRAQRRADALVELARRAGAMPPGARLPEPLFTCLVGYESFAGRICELANSTAISPGSLLRWLDEAWVERVVFDGPERITGVGVRRRLFSGATRRAIEVRDRECYHPEQRPASLWLPQPLTQPTNLAAADAAAITADHTDTQPVAVQYYASSRSSSTVMPSAAKTRGANGSTCAVSTTAPAKLSAPSTSPRSDP